MPAAFDVIVFPLSAEGSHVVLDTPDDVCEITADHEDLLGIALYNYGPSLLVVEGQSGTVLGAVPKNAGGFVPTRRSPDQVIIGLADD
jgi:hypothetical protein